MIGCNVTKCTGNAKTISDHYNILL
nr:hypothetical protein [Bartonella sp. 1-1C]